MFPVLQTTEKVLGGNNTNFPKYYIFRNCTLYTPYTVGNLKEIEKYVADFFKDSS